MRTGIRRDLLMHAACMSLEGFLMLSSGDEIGQVNDYSYKENPDTAQDSRYLHRSPFNWENAALRTVPGTVQQEIWDGLKQMEELRRNEPCFGPDARVTPGIPSLQRCSPSAARGKSGSWSALQFLRRMPAGPSACPFRNLSGPVYRGGYRTAGGAPCPLPV